MHRLQVPPDFELDKNLLRGTDSGSEAFVHRRVIGSAAPRSETLPDKTGNRTAILINQFQPRQRTHLGEIDSSETHSGDENVYAIAQRLVLERIDSLSHGFGAVHLSPPRFHLGVSFRNGHLQRRVGHLKRDELLPVLRTCQSPGGLQPFVKRCRGQRGEQTKDRQASGPSMNLFKGALRDTHSVVVHAKNKGRDGVNVALREPLEHGGVLTRFVEALVYVGKVCRVDGFHADEDPLPSGGGDEVHEFLIAQQIGADLRDPVHLGAGGDDVAQERFGALDVDGEIVVNEEDSNLAAFAFRASFQKEQLVHHAFIGAKTDGVAEESGYRAELAAIGTAAPRLHGNDAKCAPAITDALKGPCCHLWNQIKLGEVYFVPGNRGILLEARFAFLSKGIHGSVDILEVAAFGVGDNSGPGFIGFTESYGVGVARTAVSA